MRAIYGHGGHLDSGTVTICTNFQPPFNTRLQMRSEEFWPRGFRGEVVQMCERTDRRTDVHTDVLLLVLNVKFPKIKMIKLPTVINKRPTGHGSLT